MSDNRSWMNGGLGSQVGGIDIPEQAAGSFGMQGGRPAGQGLPRMPTQMGQGMPRILGGGPGMGTPPGGSGPFAPPGPFPGNTAPPPFASGMPPGMGNSQMPLPGGKKGF